MQTITKNMLKEDFNNILVSLDEDQTILPSRKSAFLMSFRYPVLTMLGYFLASIWLISDYHPKANSFGWLENWYEHYSVELVMLLFTLGLMVAVSLSLYRFFLIYLSVPKVVRENSLIFNSLKKTTAGLWVFIIVSNWTAASLVFIFDSLVLGASPAVFLVTILISQCILSSELTRLGAGSLLKKTASIVSRV